MRATIAGVDVRSEGGCEDENGSGAPFERVPGRLDLRDVRFASCQLSRRFEFVFEHGLPIEHLRGHHRT
jgi:hypothetical protein